MKLKFLKWDAIDLKIGTNKNTFHGSGVLSPGKCEFRSPILAWAWAVPTMYRTLNTKISLGYFLSGFTFSISASASRFCFALLFWNQILT